MKKKYEIKGNKAMLLDVDGTVYLKSLLMGHYMSLIESGILPKSKKLDAWNMDKKNEGLIYEVATEYKEMLKSITLNTAIETAREFVSRIDMKDIHPFVLKEIEKNRDNGVKIVLISGSPTFVVKEFARRLKVKGYGSRYEVCENKYFNGDIMPMWNGSNKASLIEKLGLDKYDEIVAFGDTVSGDGRMLSYADKKYFIQPNEENEKKIRKAFNDIIIVR